MLERLWAKTYRDFLLLFVLSFIVMSLQDELRKWERRVEGADADKTTTDLCCLVQREKCGLDSTKKCMLRQFNIWTRYKKKKQK